MEALNARMLSAGLLEALVSVAEQGSGVPSSEGRVRLAGETLGAILAREASASGEAFGRVAGRVLEHLAPGSRVLEDTGEQVVVCLPPGDLVEMPSARDRLVAAALGRLAAQQAGRAWVRAEPRLVEGETCWAFTVRLGAAGERAPDEDEYGPSRSARPRRPRPPTAPSRTVAWARSRRAWRMASTTCWVPWPVSPRRCWATRAAPSRRAACG